MEQRRSRATIEAYLKRGQLLVSTFERETGRKWEDDPVAVVEWFEAKAPGFRKSTFRLYKAALRAFMCENGPEEVATRLQAISQSIAGIQVKEHATSTGKLKKVPLDIFYAVIQELSESRSEYADLLAHWIYCNSLVGLRPAEWKSLTMKGTQLYCINAKYSFGRGRTGKRAIDLSGFDESVIQSFKTMLALIARYREQGISFEQMYASCRQLLYRVQLKLFPHIKGRLSLYSTRHQTVANFKYAGASREEIAVMFGHTSLRTAMQHYARKRSGRKMERLPVTHDGAPVAEEAYRKIDT